MKRCANCSSLNPADARFCMQCGVPIADYPAQETELKAGGMSVFALSLAGSIAISLVLMLVFDIPIFFLAGFLPLLWLRRKK